MATNQAPTEPEKDDEDPELPDPPGSGVRARVKHIADLMRDHAWRTRPMVRELAEQWGVSKKTVRTYSAEASRLVQAEMPTGEEGKVGFMRKADQIMEAAMKAGSYSAALESLKFSAALCGHVPTTKTKNEHSGPEGGPIPVARAKVVILPARKPE